MRKRIEEFSPTERAEINRLVQARVSQNWADLEGAIAEMDIDPKYKEECYRYISEVRSDSERLQAQ